MVNKNKFKIEYIKGIKLTIEKESGFSTYIIFEDQLVSILKMNIYGDTEILRGRVDKIKIVHTRETSTDTAKAVGGPGLLISTRKNDKIMESRGMGYSYDLSTIILDTSKDCKSHFETIKIADILEVNPVDATYPDTTKVVVDGPIKNWESTIEDADAPTRAIVEISI